MLAMLGVAWICDFNIAHGTLDQASSLEGPCILRGQPESKAISSLIVTYLKSLYPQQTVTSHAIQTPSETSNDQVRSYALGPAASHPISVGEHKPTPISSIFQDNPIYKHYRGGLPPTPPGSLQMDHIYPIILNPDFHYETLYQGEFKFLGGGGQATVFLAQVKDERSGLHPGNSVAVRTRDIGFSDAFQNDLLNSLARNRLNTDGAVAALAYMNQLGSDFLGRKTAVTDFFPRVYGHYVAPCFELKGGFGVSRNTARKPIKNQKDEGNPYLCEYQEMELVDSTLDAQYPTGKITDDVIAEYMIGEWAGRAILGLRQSDVKPRNIGLKKVSYSRVYHLGAETYIFPPGFTPKQLDFGDYDVNANRNADSSLFYHWNAHGITGAQRAPKETIFDVFSKYFGKYREGPDNPIPTQPDTRHYQIDQELIDEAKQITP